MTLRLTKPPLFGGSQDNININLSADSSTSKLIPNQGLSARVNPKINSRKVVPSKIKILPTTISSISAIGAN